MQKYANLVELEKCCQTHIFLQIFVLIQPRTSQQKICKIVQQIANLAADVVRPGALARREPRAGAHAVRGLDELPQAGLEVARRGGELRAGLLRWGY